MSNNFYKMKQSISSNNPNNQEVIELKQAKLSIEMNNDINLHNLGGEKDIAINNKNNIEFDTPNNYPNYLNQNKEIQNSKQQDNNLNSSTASHKKKKKPITFTLLDTIIDDVGITWYHLKIYLILSLFFLADGAEMIVISLLIKQMGEYWSLNESEKGFTGSAVFIGFFIGALVAGKVSDVRGRKPVFVLGSILVCVFSIGSAFANSFTTFLILRALNGFGIGISIPSSSSLAAEITPTNYRSWVLNLVWIFFPLGEIFATVIAKYILKQENGWRYLLGFAALPTVISAFLCFFIYESPRFYLTIRNYDKAFLGLERMLSHKKNTILDNTSNNFGNNIKQIDAGSKEVHLEANDRQNDTNNENSNNNDDNCNGDNNINDIVEKNKNKDVIRENSQEKIIMEGEAASNKNPYKDRLHKYITFNNKINEEGRKIIKIENEKEDEIKAEFKTLLRKKYIYLTLLCCFIFYACSFVYYGLIYILPQTLVYVEPKDSLLNSTNYNSTLDSLKEQENEDEMYKGVILSALSEIPSTFLTGYIGNLSFLGRKGSMMYGFILSGISGILCSLFMKDLTIFATALKFSIDIPFGVIYLYVSEAFPTKIRTISLGVTNSFNRLGGITTPIISQLAFSAQANNPYKIYAIVCFLGAIFSYLLPFETLGRNIS